MPRDGGVGEIMSATEMKPLLKLARRRPVSCAVAMVQDRQGVVLLHRRLKPRQLAAQLKSAARDNGLELDAATVRFGRASVDGASDAAKVTFTVHKAAPGAMRAALLPKLRPAGFQRCEFAVNEAFATDAEEDQDPDDGDEEEGGASAGLTRDAVGARREPIDGASPAPGAADPSGFAASVAGSPAPPASALAASSSKLSTKDGSGDWRAKVRTALTAIAPRIASSTQRGTPLRQELTDLADRANAALKADDQAEAVQGVLALSRALDSSGDASPPSAAPDLAIPVADHRLGDSPSATQPASSGPISGTAHVTA